MLNTVNRIQNIEGSYNDSPLIYYINVVFSFINIDIWFCFKYCCDEMARLIIVDRSQSLFNCNGDF